MRDTPEEIHNLQIEIYNDDKTPFDFVVDVMRTVFSKSEAEAKSFAAAVNRDGKASCGAFPPNVAQALLDAMQQRNIVAGHSLKIEALPLDVNEFNGGACCVLCGKPTHSEHSAFRGKNALACDDCILAGAIQASEITLKRKFKYAHEAIAWHFAGLRQDEIITTSRQFPGHMRADVQIAINKLFSQSPIRFFGIYEQHRYETLTFAALNTDGQHAATISAAQFQDVEIGESQPVKCLNNGLWLCREVDLRYAVVLSFHREFGRESGTCVEIAVPSGEEGSLLVQQCFQELESAINEARSYRGKVLSLEGEADYRGRSKGIMVHRLPIVRREDVILPDATLKLLDRNVIDFVESRDMLRKLGQSTRKGILLYGPPGTGKTHTIRYLAKNLADHTTLIMTAGQMGLLPQYMSLARLLQPTMVVIEDVDLIALSRENMNGPCEESLLNALLNEMDGLKDNADILFVLTTNRPEQLEAALAGRPGRIDQAIEVPLPDEIGREKLARLYGSGLKLSDHIVKEAVLRTEGASAAFIKELMRRTAQSSIAGGRADVVTSEDIGEALDDMLFTGGKLNMKLLGGAMVDTAQSLS